MMSVAFSALTQISRTKRALDDERDATLVANAVLTRMTRELQLISSQEKLLPPAGSSGKAYPKEVNVIGESKNLSGGESGDSITFMASDAGQYVPDGLTHAGVVQITYRVEKDPQAPTGGDSTFYLVRDEVPAIRPPDKAYAKIMTFPITRDLVGLRFRYFDGKSWRSDWDENQKKLPMLIRFTVKIRSPAGKVYTYTTMVPVRRDSGIAPVT
jgi:hypothetical protein